MSEQSSNGNNLPPASATQPGGGSGNAGVRADEATHGTVLADKTMAYSPTTVGGASGDVLRPGAPETSPPARRAYLQQIVHDAFVPWRSRLGALWIGLLMFMACFASFLANSHPILMKANAHWTSPILQHLAPADVVLPVVFITAAVLLVRRRVSPGLGLATVLWVAAVVTIVALPPSVVETLKEQSAGVGAWAGLQDKWAREPLITSLLCLLCGGVLALAILLPLRVLPGQLTLRAGAAIAPLLVLLLLFPVRPPRNVVYERYRQMEAAGKTQWVLRTIIPFSPTDRMNDQLDARLQAPNRAHWGGTDNYGQDLLSRMIHASRIALSIGFIATGIAVLIGVTIGGLMGYFVGWVDLIGMRLIEILESIPTLVLLIAITAAYGRNLYMMMAVIGLLRWTGDARFIRAEFLRLRNQDFVQAAIACGLPLRTVIFRHMLPNGISPVLVSASFGVASAILLEATLSFLGLGLVDEASWGEMLNQARAGGAGFNWWIALFPGALIFLTVFSYNLIGESVRDALDPKLLKRES